MSEDIVARLRRVSWADAPPTMDEAAAEIERLRERAERAEAALRDMRERKDGAYEERNRVVAALARVFPSGTKRTDIPGWDAEWHGCVYLDLPSGQVSWHYHDNQAHLFAGLPAYAGEWDGHDTPEKYRRLAALAGSLMPDQRVSKVVECPVCHATTETDGEAWCSHGLCDVQMMARGPAAAPAGLDLSEGGE